MREVPPKEHTVLDVDQSPIFIIGTGRSGTTLLRQMLNAHPRIHITHEAGFYTYLHHAPFYTSAQQWLERYFATFSFAWLRLDPKIIASALPKDLSIERIDEAFRVIMRCKAQQQGKVRYGDKNPLDTQNLQRIFTDFADPRIVYITRDPRPTVLSYNRVPFGTSSSLLNSFICSIQYRHVKPYLDRILEVRLEDLSADPRSVMQTVLRFVGEPWDEAVLDHVHHAAADDVPPLPWFVRATHEQPGGERAQNEQSWRERLPPVWIQIIEQINRRNMQHYGYVPAPLNPPPGFWQRAWAVLKDLPGAFATGFRMLAFRRKLVRHFQGLERLDAQRGMEENVRLNPAAWRHYPGFQMPQVPRFSYPDMDGNLST